MSHCHTVTLVTVTQRTSSRASPSVDAMLSSMNPLGLPTVSGSRLVEPTIAPTMDPLPAHSCAGRMCMDGRRCGRTQVWTDAGVGRPRATACGRREYWRSCRRRRGRAGGQS
eukprot:365082-Chlamydomonas_euryale.AAC.10